MERHCLVRNRARPIISSTGDAVASCVGQSCGSNKLQSLVALAVSTGTSERSMVFPQEERRNWHLLAPTGFRSRHSLPLVRAYQFSMSIFAAKEAGALHEGSLHIRSELRVFLIIRNQNRKDKHIKRPENWGRGRTAHNRQHGNTQAQA